MEEDTGTAMVSLNNTHPQAPSSQADSTASSTPPHTASTSTSWAQWDSTDTAHLAPANLAVSKVQHAWERKPQSPFTRRRLKVGKVWKRAGGVSAPSTSMFNFGGSGATIRPESPMRAVKKMRGPTGEQVVRGWNMRGSPRNRRIVTRSNRDEKQELLELEADDVEQDMDAEDATPQEEVLRVEIEHEDGTIVELDAEEGEAEEENENWDDDSMTEEVWDATLMHLAENIGEPGGARDTVTGDSGEEAQEVVQPPTEEMDTEESMDHAMPAQDDATAHEQLHSEQPPQQPESPPKQPVEALPVPQLKSVLKRTSQFGAIPDGFVSPVKAAAPKTKRRTINDVRNRRRTLPVNFAAQHPAANMTSVEEEVREEVPSSEAVDEVNSETAEDVQDTPQHTDVTAETLVVPCEEVSGADMHAALDEDDSDVELRIPLVPEVAHSDEIPIDGTHDDNAWEDVDEEESPEQAEDEMGVEPAEQQVEAATDVQSCQPEPVQDEQESVSTDTAPASSPKLDLNTKPLLNLRRSPRRQSTSPVRPSGILPSSSRSHLVAFTPITLPVYTSPVELQSSPLPGNPSHDSMDIDNDNPNPLPQSTRSSSAPPEEPKMSPRRPKQPRISDDTALLTAFLNRAAESKTSKDSSITAKRESIENRRDSTSVRQALASPGSLAKTVAGDVLADLDPNSPSPRKQSLAASLAEAAQTNGKSADDQDQDELALNATPDKKASRQSRRVKNRNAETLPASTFAATNSVGGPNRIAIRGADSVVVLKKTEAQEIAQVTRFNTKKNKRDSVLAHVRLTRLAAEQLRAKDEIAPPDEEDEMDVDVPVKAGRRGVKWADTLVHFHEGANEPEMSILSDELNVPEESAAPPASETPSKPSRLRKLRTPRPTASSAGSSKATQEAVVAAAEPTPAAEVAKAPRTTKRNSRIATPAKLPGAAKSLLPDGLDDVEEPVAPVSTTKKAPITRKKAPSSKLPAPASSLGASTAVGKENSLIASPPKKRSTATRTFAVPKLDFKGAMNAAPVIAPPTAGITASPAKRGRAQGLFKENGDVSVKREEALGMASPAKKRSRRVL